MQKILQNFFLKTTTKTIIDIFMLSFGYFFSLFLKYDLNWSQNFKLDAYVFFLFVSIFVILIRKTNNKSWVFLNSKDLFFTGIDIGIINSLFFLGTVFLGLIYPRHLIFGNLIIGLFATFTPRFLLRLLFILENRKKACGKRCLIVGAGTATDLLLREYNRNSKMNFQVVGLIDDNPKKKNTIMHNYKVLGNRNDLPKVILDNSIELIIIAIPSASGKDIKEIYNLSKVDGVEIKILPNFSELLETKSMSSQLRDVQVEDLLGREVIEVNTKTINKYLEGKVVFITGGAGSIGSELSRQISKYNPEVLVNIDVNESALYFLELEIKREHPNVRIISEICNIREREKLEYLFDKYKPQIVYHAAAHKHVPLMEHNPEEAIKNNVFGSNNVLNLADKYQVERFVLISTDKAVNPTNIMGTTKRITELLLENINKRSKTKFMAVRFGNVLGSNGSVIPIFKNLIREGKNLTVTHQDITRYFMTIPEASQLVLEAGGLGNGGEVFVLDMGEPVRIMDLAKNLIELSGLTLGVDIEIEITGLRPGEKLCEELLYDVNNAEKTENKKIFIAKLKDENVDTTYYLEKLKDIISKNEFGKIKPILKEFVTSYKEPEHHKCNRKCKIGN